jgi:triacylglycerol lipase
VQPTIEPPRPTDQWAVIAALRIIVEHVWSLIVDVVSAVALAILFPLNLEWFDPKKTDSKEASESGWNQRPILLIHGFLGSSNNWVYQRYRLHKAGYRNVFTVNLGDPRKSIEEYVKTVAAKAKEIGEITGRSDLTLIAHSMGGLVAQRYLYTEPGAQERVKTVITIGTPCLGTKVAYLASLVSSAAREMIPDSEFIRQLASSARSDKTTNYVHIASKTDMIVRPTTSALGVERPRSSTRVLNPMGHVTYLFSSDVANQLEESLKASQ